MGPAKWTALATKVVVTVVALLALVLHLSFERTRLDTTGLVLIFLAMLPWLATIISRAPWTNMDGCSPAMAASIGD